MLDTRLLGLGKGAVEGPILASTLVHARPRVTCYRILRFFLLVIPSKAMPIMTPAMIDSHGNPGIPGSTRGVVVEEDAVTV
jgi:hypothetical protein